MTSVSHVKATFVDDDGVRWTVVPIPAGRVLGAGAAGLTFVSETGERRVTNRPPTPGGTPWRSVEASVWCALLRDALLVT
jgi:hypothetical protein